MIRKGNNKDNRSEIKRKVAKQTAENHNRRQMSPASKGSYLIPKEAGSIFERQWRT